MQRWRVRVPGGLVGHAIKFPELTTQRIDVLVRVVRADGTAQVGRLKPAESSFEVAANPGALEVARTYTLLGFDRLMIVLALLVLVHGVKRLVATITAFTVAHSIMLALATLGAYTSPGRP